VKTFDWAERPVRLA